MGTDPVVDLTTAVDRPEVSLECEVVLTFIPTILKLRHHIMVFQMFPITDPSTEIIVSRFGYNITAGDLETLSECNLVNDNIINFYLKLIEERSVQSQVSVYAFSSHFYLRLTLSSYYSVERWTKKVTMSSPVQNFVPISAHIAT